MKNIEQLKVENEAMKETIAVLLAQKRTTTKDLKQKLAEKYIFVSNTGERLVFIGCPPTRTNQFEWKGKIYELKEVITYGI